MSKLKLIALDMDGTLLGSDRAISKRNMEAIRKAERQGIYVILATGRMYRSAKEYSYLFTSDMPVIAYNGGLIREFNDGRILFQQNMPKELVAPTFDLAKGYGLGANFYIDDNLYGNEGNPYIAGYAEYIGVPYEIIPDRELHRTISEGDIMKMVAMGPAERVDHFLKDHISEMGRQLYLAKSWPGFLEIAHKETNKGLALKSLGEILGIRPEEMMAIGDNLNDHEMLEYVGYPVIMANGHEYLLDKHYYRTKTNDEDGVAHAISQFI